MLRRNVLIFQTGGLGDFVLTWPFAVALARIYPQSRIIFVTHPQKGALARRVLRLEATDIEAGWHGLFAEDGKLPPPAQKLIESAHAIYTFLPTGPTWHRNVQKLNLQARCVEIDARIGPDFRGHLTGKILAALKDCPPEKSALEQMLRSIADRGIGYRPVGGSDVVIHPGSGSPAKCWPLARYLKLADRLQQANRKIRFVIGEVELEKWSEQDRQQLESCAPLRQCKTYLDLLEEIQTAGAFIGNDSGPAHLAGIIGMPTLAIFGPTDPAQWKPLGPHVRVVRHQPMEDLTVDLVFTAAADSALGGRSTGCFGGASSDDEE